MRVLTKEELINEPNGTVYIPYTPKVFTGEIHIITGKNDKTGEWNGELPFLPWTVDEDGFFYTNWATVDNTWWELDNNKTYAVFSKNEILKMIECLQWALTGCKTYFNQDQWWSELCDFPLSDDDVEEYK